MIYMVKQNVFKNFACKCRIFKETDYDLYTITYIQSIVFKDIFKVTFIEAQFKHSKILPLQEFYVV